MYAILINSLAGGGAERVALTMLNEWRRDGHEVKLICLERESGYEVAPEIKVQYLTNFDKLENPIVKLIWMLISAYRLSNIIRHQNIKMVQSHLIRSNWVNVAAKKFGAEHIAQIVSHLPIEVDGKFPKYLLQRFFHRWYYSRADHAVSISEVMKRGIERNLNLKSPEIFHEVVHNPHDLNHIQRQAQSQVIDFTFDRSKKYLITIGRQLKHKRVEVIIRALSEVRKSKSCLELIVIGEGEDKAFFQQIAETCNLEHCVHFLGFKSNPFAFLSRSDILILASEREGLPNIIIESLACGTPVISSDCISGPREILSPGSDLNRLLKDNLKFAEFGVLFPIGRADLLADAIITMLQDDALMSQYRERGLERVKLHDKSTITRNYLEGMLQAQNRSVKAHQSQ